MLKGDRYSPETDSSWLWQKFGGGGSGKEVRIYSGKTLAGGETVDVCVCVGVRRGGWMMLVLRGFSWGCICDPVLSARSVVKAFRIRPPPLPTPQNSCKQPPSLPHTRTSSPPGFQL